MRDSVKRPDRTFFNEVSSIVAKSGITTTYRMDLEAFIAQLVKKNDPIMRNPFLAGVKLPMKYKAIDIESSELDEKKIVNGVNDAPGIASIETTIKFWNEVTPHIGISIINSKLLLNLTSQGNKVLFGYIIPTMKPYALDVIMKHKKVSEYLTENGIAISESSVKLGIKNLIQSGIVHQVHGRPSIYWINFQLFFRGYVVNAFLKYLQEHQIGETEITNAITKSINSK